MPRTRDNYGEPFDRIYVDYALRSGVARVTWELRDDFLWPEPHSFQLQANPNWDEPDDWEDVGAPVVNQFYAIDDEQRECGKGLRAAYRVVLTTSEETYTSEVAQTYGNMTKRQWLLARAMMRRFRLQSRQLEKFPGYLMKRRIHNAVCTECVHPITGGIINSDCLACKGTGKVDGYWKAVEDTLFECAPENEDTKRSQRGTVNDNVIVGRFIGIPPVKRNDVWIEADSDRRYVVNSVRGVAELRRVPLIVQAELRLVEFGDVLYDVDPEEGN